MNRSFFTNNIQFLRFQRNIFVVQSFLLIIAVITLSCFLFLKRERIIVTPAIVEKEFWVDSRHISPTYLEQYGCFISQLLLSKSTHSAPSQRTILLRHVDPSFVGTLRKKLFKEEELLQKQSASYTFYPVTIQANPQTKEVLIEGDRIFYVFGKQVSSAREGYVLSFHYTGSRLLLSGITFKERRGES